MTDEMVTALALEFTANARIIDLWNELDVFDSTSDVDKFRDRCRELLARPVRAFAP